MSTQIQYADGFHFWLFTAIASAVSLAGFYFLYQGLMRARIIEDTPTSRIRSASQGYCELVGTGDWIDGPPILSPLTGRECIWYQYNIARRESRMINKSRQSHWRTIESGISEQLFRLTDTTGDCVIDPDGATVDKPHTRVWHGHSRRPTGAKTANSGFAALVGNSFGQYRYTERWLSRNEQIYAIGRFRTEGTDYHSDLKQDTADILRQLKKDKPRLEKYDANHDGEIDLQEWEVARKDAENQALMERAGKKVSDVTHVLGKTANSRQPFILSTRSQDHLARRYRITAGLSLSVFFLGGAATVWLLLARF